MNLEGVSRMLVEAVGGLWFAWWCARRCLYSLLRGDVESLLLRRGMSRQARAAPGMRSTGFEYLVFERGNDGSGMRGKCIYFVEEVHLEIPSGSKCNLGK